jgi:hypothetical protein
MLRKRSTQYVVLSICLHLILIGASVLITHPEDKKQTHLQEVTTIDVTKKILVNGFSSSNTPVTSSKKPRQAPRQWGIDLRPHFLINGSLFSTTKNNAQTGDTGTGNDKNHPSGIPNPYARDLLLTETKVIAAFDLLAEKINQNLDYPIILLENGVQGTATLDLYFDHEGNVDEGRSKFFGANRSVRGLLVKASRQGLMKWYLADIFRLQRDQFKDQHFRAEFTISYSLPSISEIQKPGMNSYAFVRRRYVHECINPTGLDVACAAIKLSGAIQRETSTTYKIRLQALQDQLEQYDVIGLNGIGAMIQGA